jgi:hypothetical protein
MPASSTVTHAARCEQRMPAAGFLKRHVWVSEEQAGRLEEIAAEMPERYRPDRVKTLDEALHRLRARRAAGKLGSGAEARCPEIPWGQVRGLENWLRHDDHQMDYSAIREAVTADLRALRAGRQRQLTR